MIRNKISGNLFIKRYNYPYSMIYHNEIYVNNPFILHGGMQHVYLGHLPIQNQTEFALQHISTKVEVKGNLKFNLGKSIFVTFNATLNKSFMACLHLEPISQNKISKTTTQVTNPETSYKNKNFGKLSFTEAAPAIECQFLHSMSAVAQKNIYYLFIPAAIILIIRATLFDHEQNLDHSCKTYCNVMIPLELEEPTSKWDWYYFVPTNLIKEDFLDKVYFSKNETISKRQLATNFYFARKKIVAILFKIGNFLTFMSISPYIYKLYYIALTGASQSLYKFYINFMFNKTIHAFFLYYKIYFSLLVHTILFYIFLYRISAPLITIINYIITNLTIFSLTFGTKIIYSKKKHL